MVDWTSNDRTIFAEKNLSGLMMLGIIIILETSLLLILRSCHGLVVLTKFLLVQILHGVMIMPTVVITIVLTTSVDD
jgi:uncharacterized membrane protein YesL